jgi:hypothetical protein
MTVTYDSHNFFGDSNMASDAERKRKSRAKLAEAGFTEVTLKLPKTLVEKLDQIAKKCGTSRTEVIGKVFAKLSAAP